MPCAETSSGEANAPTAAGAPPLYVARLSMAAAAAAGEEVDGADGGEGEGEGGGGGVVSVVGGETAFFRDCREGARELFRVAPKRGDALVFVHGDACLPHASLEVRRGVKVVLRSDVF